jgi:hypothetical protein
VERKLVLILASFIVLLSIVPAAISAEISVGVKQGDWIEYQIAFSGTPPEGFDVTWARMEIVGVQGGVINLNLTTRFSNGTQKNEAITLNIETGQLGDEFIVPANLNGGDIFFDKNVGNMTIKGVEDRTCAGSRRTVVYATTPQTMFYWDRSTGVLVEANSSFTDFTLHSRADKTNMWQAQMFGLDSTVFYALVISGVAILAVIALLVLRRKK